jgi:hypothetical protein
MAWALGTIAIGLLTAGYVVEPGRSPFLPALVVAFSGVGALVASRHPRNAVGWIFLGVGLSTALGSLAGAVADRWTTAAVYANLGWIPFILVPCTFVLLLFPDGHLVSPRWRWVAWCAGAGITGIFLLSIIRPGPLDDYPGLENPYGIESPVLDLLALIALVAVGVAIVGSGASLIVRFHRARGELRQQIKWLVLAGAVAAVVVPVAIAGSGVWGEDVMNIACMFGVLCLPLAAGAAMLRYRLYDIDVVINRALVYGVLTAALAAAYLACVLLLQLALTPLTSDSGLAVAASTLAVAALFRPARTRIQAAVDRRFYRRRYDAAKTLAAFSTSLREELDLDALDANLRRAVAEALQPTHVSLWLADSGLRPQLPHRRQL